jgi:sec-independent protein translocase protein TatA
MGALSAWHWAIVLIVIVVLFGSKKLPEAARGLGRSLRIFKSEVKEMQNDGKDTSAPSEQASTVTPPAQLPPAEAPYTTGNAHNPESKSA